MADTQENMDKRTKEYTRINGKNKTLSQQVDLLREHENNLSNLLEEREQTIEETQTKLNEVENATDKNSGNTMPSLSNDLQKWMNERFTKIEENIDQLISKKLTDNVKMVEAAGAKINDVIDQNKSYAKSLKKNLEASNLESLMKTTKNNELIQEKERERRSANLIIYGIDEVSDNQSDSKEHDRSFINSFLDTIGITHHPKQIIRLGKPNENNKRPVKLVMDNSAHKDSIMSRLGNLKNAEEIYRNVSVRHDYTIEERDLIKEWVKKAEEKNKEEDTQAWKVRGTPKNGLRLVKITRRR